MTSGCPCSLANATVTTSVDPNSEPSAAETVTTAASQRHRIGVRLRSVRAVVGGGWVARSPANQAPPTNATAMTETRARLSETPVASSVTSTGPTMKMLSSTTASNEKAVWSSAGSFTTNDHRARTHEPIGG